MTSTPNSAVLSEFLKKLQEAATVVVAGKDDRSDNLEGKQDSGDSEGEADEDDDEEDDEEGEGNEMDSKTQATKGVTKTPTRSGNDSDTHLSGNSDNEGVREDEDDEDEDEDEEVDKADKDEEDSNPSADRHMKLLEQIAETVRAAESASFSEQERQVFIDAADAKISDLCHEVYSEDLISQLYPYGLPKGPEHLIKTKTPSLLSGSVVSQFINEMLQLFGGPNGGPNPRVKSLDDYLQKTGKTTDPWSTTARPNPQHSSKLARFSHEYNQAEIDTAFSAIASVEVRNSLLPVLQASAVVQSNNIGSPCAMALGGDLLVLSVAGGYKQRAASAKIFSIPAGRGTAADDEDKDGEDASLWLGEKALRTGFAGPFNNILVDSYAIWCAGDERIKAFDRNDGSLLHTLSCRGGFEDGMFGVCEDRVFRANAKGDFISWKIDDLQGHPLSMGQDSNQRPFGGAIEEHHLGWLDSTNAVEMSRGQPPTSTFSVPNISGKLDILVNMPDSTQYLAFGTSEYEGSVNQAPYGVRLFDLYKPEAGARVVGLGLGSPIGSLRVHRDLPGMFVAAGIDDIVRIYDIRSPPNGSALPQIVLSDHCKGATSCAIASFGGQYPVIFTGGEDEVVRAWDIRHTKKCLYDLSAGCMSVESLEWHDKSRTLFVMGQNMFENRMGGHHRDEYEKLAPRPNTNASPTEQTEDLGDDDDEEGDWSGEATCWPRKAHIPADYFGRRWFASSHSILQYRFKARADPNSCPPWDRPYFESGGW